MKFFLSLTALLLSACTSTPPAPDWQGNAFAALKGFTSAYLEGNTRLADFEFARARTEIASTGRVDLMARAELTRCAVRVASLEFDDCAPYQDLAKDAQPQEQAYAAYLNGRWANLDPALLPPQHRALVTKVASSKASTSQSPVASVLPGMKDPLARLVAAGVLLQQGQLTPADIELALQAASSQGWRRPLLAWLGVALAHARSANDPETQARIQRRIDLVLQTSGKPQ